MTQVATTVASISGKAPHSAKSATAKGGAGADFASLAAGLGLSADDGDAAADADGLALTKDDAGTGKGAGKGKGKSAVPDSLDLGSNVATPSAAPATILPAAQVPAKADTRPDLPKTDEAVALDGKAAGRPSWRMMKDKAAAAADGTVVTGKGAKAAKPDADAVAQSATAVPDTILPVEAQALAQQLPGQAPPQSGGASPARPTRQNARTDGIQTGATLRQTTADPAKAATADKADASLLPPIFSALPQAVRDPKQQPPVPAVATQPVDGKVADPAQLATAQLAVTDMSAAPQATTGRSSTSALHRTASVTGDARAVNPADAQAQPVAETTRNGADTPQDQGKGSDSGTGTATLGNDGQATSATDAGTSAANQFSDILQSLPPIAQSRMGVVAAPSPAVTGAADVGATLQGQAIDMGVGGQWIDRMAKEITALAAGNGNSRFQLSPPNLGRIQVDIRQGEGGSQVHMMTETDEAARRLNDGKPGLEADARMSALSINSITIERSSASFDGGRDPNPQQSGQQNQQNPQQGSQRHQQASDQPFGQTGTQTGGQGSQAGSQANAQANSQGQQNSNGQGKGPWSRDVLNERAGTAVQDGGAVRRDGDRLVRYA